MSLSNSSSGSKGFKVVVTASIDAEVVSMVRRHCQRRGDFSRIVEEALRMWLSAHNIINNAPQNSYYYTESLSNNIKQRSECGEANSYYNAESLSNNNKQGPNIQNKNKNNKSGEWLSAAERCRELWPQVKDCDHLMLRQVPGGFVYFCAKWGRRWKDVVREKLCPCDSYVKRRKPRGELLEEYL